MILLLRRHRRATLVVSALLLALPVAAQRPLTVTAPAGALRGMRSSDGAASAWLGVPYAAAPVGTLRWRAPQPAPRWRGVREATQFGARCMQAPVFSDMIFRDSLSEDCLFLNVWAPSRRSAARLPVMVWIHGGGFMAGSASEPRQDGTQLTKEGVIVVGINYRLGVFGFMSHAVLSAESGHRASGNYGLMDQVAALQWVKRNIAAFGGDPNNVTIFGESAGSFAVSALMAMPSARGLFQKAIGESGAFMGATLAAAELPAAEKAGSDFLSTAGVSSMEALRALPAAEILKVVSRPGGRGFSAVIDGYVLPRNVRSIYADGQQHHVPLMAGWNADEMRSATTLAPAAPTAEGFASRVKAQFGPNADSVLAVYPTRTPDETLESAASFTSDMFISASTWAWLELHRQTGRSRVFRYRFDRRIPIAPGQTANGKPVTAADVGARHAGEIEYVFGTLESVPGVTWEAADHALSALMRKYWTNFARSGNPAGAGVPAWPAYMAATGNQVMFLNVESKADSDPLRRRYETVDRVLSAPRVP